VKLVNSPAYHPGSDGLAPIIARLALASMEGAYICCIGKPKYGTTQHRHKGLMKVNNIKVLSSQYFLDSSP
jgi:hypothetical protein